MNVVVYFVHASADIDGCEYFNPETCMIKMDPSILTKLGNRESLEVYLKFKT